MKEELSFFDVVSAINALTPIAIGNSVETTLQSAAIEKIKQLITKL